MATQVGTAVVKLSFDGKDIKAELSSIESSAKKSGTSAGNILGNTLVVAAGNIIAKGVGKAFSAISSSIDTAIKRVDTLNQFPKIMKNFGVSADESTQVINRLNTNLLGLPTRLDDAAGSVRDLFLATKDLKQAEDLFYAINNAALVFAGGSSEAVDRFIYAYRQAMAAGRASAQDFNQMNEAIPGLMDKVAEAMGITTLELKEGLSNGAIGMNEFNEALNKLNAEGVGDMQSLETAARDSTDGIGTSIENVKTRIAAGIAKIIDTIGAEEISTAIDNISSGFSKIAEVVKGIISFLQSNQWITDFLLNVVAVLGTLGVAIGVINAVMATSPITWIILGVSLLIAGIVTLIQHFNEVSAWIHENLPWLGNILDAIGNLFNTIGQIAGQVFNAIGNFFQSIIVPIFQKIGEFLGPIIGALFEAVGAKISSIVNIFSTVFGVVGNILSGLFNFFVNIFSGIGNFIGGVVNNIRGFFEGLGNGIRGIFEGIRNVVSNIFSAIGGIIKAPINGIINGINGVISMINSIQIPDWVPVIGGAHANIGYIPTLAEGGSTTGPTTAIIGEAGREVVIPLERNQDNWAGLLASTLAQEMEFESVTENRPITVYMTNEINNDMDADDIGRKLMTSIRRAA